MPWGNQRPPMPDGWDAIRRRVLQDSDICYVCGKPGADEVDHKKPRHLRGGEEDNLAPIHSVPCHRKKTAREGVEARRRLKARQKRPPERHPGYR